MKRRLAVLMFLPPAFAGFLLLHVQHASSQAVAVADPGVRPGPASAGKPLPGLSPLYIHYFDAGRDDFSEVETVADGLGPTMNLDSCGGCHSQPDIGGSSPKTNPQVAFATKMGNAVPSFLSSNGPIREARFIRNPNGTPDGSVHSLFTIGGCSQENFQAAVNNRNVSFRIPTPVFGAGLIELIPDSAILANLSANGTQSP